MEQLQRCVERWLDALNSRGQKEAVSAACAPDVVVERYGFADQRGVLVQTIRGRHEIGRWFTLPAEGTRFSLLEACSPDDEASDRAGRVRYRVQVLDFVGGGVWRFRCDEQGLLTWLEHRPDELNEP